MGLSEVDTGFDHKGRLLSATCGGLRIHRVYVPNGHRLGTPHWYAKLAWLARLAEHLATAGDCPTVVAGDWDVTPATSTSTTRAAGGAATTPAWRSGPSCAAAWRSAWWTSTENAIPGSAAGARPGPVTPLNR
jgi:exonuclease III